MTRRISHPVRCLCAIALALGSIAGAASAGTTTTTRTSYDDSGNNFSYFYSVSSSEKKGDLAYALIDPGHPDLSQISIKADRAPLKSTLAKIKAPLMWFHRDGASYVVNDRLLVDAGLELTEPMLWLGQTQCLVFKGQSDVQAEQERLTRELAELAETLGELSLKTAVARRDGEDVSDFLRERRAIKERHRALLEGRADLDRKKSMLGEKQRDLGATQSRMIDQLAQAIGDLFEDARNQGKAVPIRKH